MKIAERGRTAPALIAVSLASLGLLLLPGDKQDEPEQIQPKPRCQKRKQAPPPAAECPQAVRAQVGLDATAVVACVAAEAPHPVYFVIGHYQTTEAWERLGIVSRDGKHVLVPFVDRPSRANQGAKLQSYVSVDLEGDGRAELIGTWLTPSSMRHEVIGVRGGELTYAISSGQPSEMLEEPSPCKLRVRGAEVLFDNDRACRTEHVLSFAGDRFVQR
jgi:hypothetical protein